MTMWGRRTARGCASAGIAMLLGLALAPVASVRAQDTGAAQVASTDSGVVLQSSPAVAQTQDVGALQARRGGGRGGRGARGGGRKAGMLGHLMTLMTLGAAGGAVYGVIHVRRLRDAHARLQDTIAGQARQLAEIKDRLERS